MVRMVRFSVSRAGVRDRFTVRLVELRNCELRSSGQQSIKMPVRRSDAYSH